MGPRGDQRRPRGAGSDYEWLTSWPAPRYAATLPANLWLPWAHGAGRVVLPDDVVAKVRFRYAGTRQRRGREGRARVDVAVTRRRFARTPTERRQDEVSRHGARPRRTNADLVRPG